MVAVVLEATRSISDAIFALQVLFKRAYVNTYEFFEILAYKREIAKNEKLIKELAYALKIEYPFESEDYIQFLARDLLEDRKNA